MKFVNSIKLYVPQTKQKLKEIIFIKIQTNPVLLLQANEMLLAGRKLTALEAHQAGLVSHVFWPTSMMQEVVPRLQQMAQNSAKVSGGAFYGFPPPPHPKKKQWVYVYRSLMQSYFIS